jgi:menaquinone-specific isochorismate synthase
MSGDSATATGESLDTSGVTRSRTIASIEFSATQLWTDADLLDFIPAEGTAAWILGRNEEQSGLVGIGTAARFECSGRERFARAQRWWNQWLTETGLDVFPAFGRGPIAFMSFAFDADADESVVVVPEFIVGRNGLQWWITGPADELVDLSQLLRRLRRQDEPAPHTHISWSDGSIGLAQWQQAVARAVGRIEARDLDKVVLARDVIGIADAPIDVAWVMRKLNESYSNCWTFFVDGLFGATPELLVSREGTHVHSRVLAGTMKRSRDEVIDQDLAVQLMDSHKDLDEHRYAVQSVADALAAHCTDMSVPAEPSLLQLANVQHLATDVIGELAADTPVVALAASLHPTAAVCGTPTERAAKVIVELEGMNRGRYAAPVGWSSAYGDGEYGIALRCGEILDHERTRVRLFAGCGLVAASTPESERAESEAKLQAMRNALTP